MKPLREFQEFKSFVATSLVDSSFYKQEAYGDSITTFN